MPVPPRVAVYQSAAIDGTGCAVIRVSFAAGSASFPIGNAWRGFLQMIQHGALLAFSSVGAYCTPDHQREPPTFHIRESGKCRMLLV
jgi:hypothetical protein